MTNDSWRKKTTIKILLKHNCVQTLWKLQQAITVKFCVLNQALLKNTPARRDAGLFITGSYWMLNYADEILLILLYEAAK